VTQGTALLAIEHADAVTGDDLAEYRAIEELNANLKRMSLHLDACQIARSKS
jgi:hypothetical protein